jgi:hypothetical protein
MAVTNEFETKFDNFLLEYCKKESGLDLDDKKLLDQS